MDKKHEWTPYTYLIGWSCLDKWYYGVRYAEKYLCLYSTGCHPDDLWNTYFTSSSIVKEFIEKNGQPDVISIRKTFPKNPVSARLWEEKVLKKINALESDRWLNRNDKLAPPVNRMFGDNNPMSNLKGEKSPNFGKIASVETRQKMRNNQLGKKYSDETNMKKGRKGKLHNSYGKKRSDESRTLMKSKALNRKDIKCPHCDKIGKPGNMAYWHFDNCKFKGIINETY